MSDATPSPRQLHRIVEIGAGDRAVSQGCAAVADVITLYEPNVILHDNLKEATSKRPNVTVRPEAVGAAEGTQPLYHLGYASYLAGMPSFLELSVESEGRARWDMLARPVPVITANQAIPEDTDCLVLTANGAEVTILSAMTARPIIIRTKAYCHAAAHWGAFRYIEAWMHANGYVPVVLERNTHSTFFHLEWRKGGI